MKSRTAPSFRESSAVDKVDHEPPVGVGVGVGAIPSPRTKKFRPTPTARREMAKCRRVLGLPKVEPKDA